MKHGLITLVGLVCYASSAHATDYPAINIEFDHVEIAEVGDALQGKHTITYHYKIERDAGTDPTLKVQCYSKWSAEWTPPDNYYTTGYCRLMVDGLVQTQYNSPSWNFANTMIQYWQNDNVQPAVYQQNYWMQTFIWTTSRNVTIDLSEDHLLVLMNEQNPPTQTEGTYNGPDLNWWTAFKEWLGGFFTVSAEEMTQIHDMQSSIMNWGPIGYYLGISGELNGAKDTAVSEDWGDIGSGGYKTGTHYMVHVKDPNASEFEPNSYPVWWSWDLSANTFAFGSMEQSGTETMWQGAGSPWLSRIAWVRGLMAAAVTVLWGFMLSKRVLPNVLRAFQ